MSSPPRYLARLAPHGVSPVSWLVYEGATGEVVAGYPTAEEAIRATVVLNDLNLNVDQAKHWLTTRPRG